MEENKIVLVDIDEVLWYLLDSWIKWINKKHRLTIKLEDCKAWDITLLFPTLTWSQIFEPLFTPSFWDTVKPREDAQKYIPMLQEKGYKIILVSAAEFASVSPKISSLLKHFPTIKEEDIIICSRKDLVRGDFLIDDKVENLANRKYPILMSTWHNRDYKDSAIPRVDNWEEIYNYIIEK